MKAWNWGFWKMVARDPFRYEFVKGRAYEFADDLVLAEADYGNIWDAREKEIRTKISSSSTGHGGETTIDVGDEDRKMIAAAVNEYRERAELMARARLDRPPEFTANITGGTITGVTVSPEA